MVRGIEAKEFISKKRDLSGLGVVYLVLDGIRLAVRPGTLKKEAVLVSMGILRGWQP